MRRNPWRSTQRAVRLRRARCKERTPLNPGASNWPMEAHSFWTASTKSICHCRPSCSNCCRMSSSAGLAARRTGAVQLRVICAAQIARLEAGELTLGRFRQDLFYRINVVSIELPSLRSRSEDILDLTAYFRRNLIERAHLSMPSKSPSQAALQLLEKHLMAGQYQGTREFGRTLRHSWF